MTHTTPDDALAGGDPVSEPTGVPVLRTLTACTTYRPGWKFKVDTFNGRPALWIEVEDEDAYHPGERIRVPHVFVIPWIDYGMEEWIEWLFDRCRDVDRHEACEFFKVNGWREFEPRHGPGENPYRVYRTPNPDRRPLAATRPPRRRCPVHGIPDCSPLLNGCSLLTERPWRASVPRGAGGVADDPTGPGFTGGPTMTTGGRP